jgi:putative spermidine/putrescine transport system substrate-binding protein
MTRIKKPIKRREFLATASAVAVTASVGPFFHVTPAKADKGELVVVSWGGAWNKALREVMFADFERETGIKVRDDAPPKNAKIKAMVESGNVTWDIIDTDMPAVFSLMKDDLLEPIDYSKLDKSKLDNIPNELQHSHALGHKIYSFNIVYNTNTFPTGKHPGSWADVWDAKKFPGARTFNFRGGVSPQLEVALLADGVSTDKLYPLDVDRGWKSFDRLRPLVTKWYASHSVARSARAASRPSARAHRSTSTTIRASWRPTTGAWSRARRTRTPRWRSSTSRSRPSDRPACPKRCPTGLGTLRRSIT